MRTLLLTLASCAAWAAPLAAEPQAEAAEWAVAECGPAAAQVMPKASETGLVVAAKELARGVEDRIVKMPDGSLKRELALPLEARAARAVTPARTAAKSVSPKAASVSYTLYESFEDYDGTSSDWIPSDWTRVVSDETLIGVNGNSTWHVTTPGILDPEAPDGSYVAACNWAVDIDYDTYTYYDQDEWLISPSFSPTSSDALSFYATYTPLYLFNLNYVDWTTYEFTSKQTAVTMKVYLREDEGDWVELLNLYDIYEDYDFYTLLYNYSDAVNYQYSFSLSDYAGKTVQVAFQIVGTDGNTMSIDAVKVASPSPEALYSRPDGAFYYGLSDTYSVMSSGGKGFMLVPVYARQTWTNLSNEEAEEFVWTYSDTDGSTATTADTDLTTYYEPNYSSLANRYDVPSLTASAAGGGADSTYQWSGAKLQAGGKAYNTTSGTEYGVGNYDYFAQGFTRLVSGSTPYMGYSSGTDSVLAEALGVTSLHEYAVGNYFAKPERPYALWKVSAHGNGTVGQGASLKIYMIEVDDQGYLGDTVATATCSGGEQVARSSAYPTYLTFPFILTDTITVSTAIYVSIEGFDDPDNVETLGFYQGAYPSETQECDAYFQFTCDGESYLYPLSVFTTSRGVCYTSFLINLFMAYTWFEPADQATYDSDGAIVCTAPVEGGSIACDILSWLGASSWTCQIDEDADWLTAELSDAREDSDAYDGRGTITFTVDENTSEQARSATATIGIPGSYQTFTITQEAQDSGVATACSQPGVKVAVTGGDVVITAPEQVTGVRVYNVAGQLLETASVSGSTTLSAQSLAGGVYVLRFNDGSTVKIIK